MAAGSSISRDDFRRFRDYFYRKTGIYFDDSKRYYVDKRLEGRIADTRSRDFQDYFSRLRFDAADPELQSLINTLTVNETYFFREEYQFRALAAGLLDEIAARKAPGERIRIWSMPCSTGEEPYSIAIYLLEYWRGIDRWDVEILASDIDSDALGKAAAGIYHERALRQLPPGLLGHYFQRLPDGQYQISEDLRASVAFSRVNILDGDEAAPYRGFDVVFCRNLLIYFDDLSRRLAAETLFDALNPGGFICLGHSESMSRISPLFKVRKFPDAIVYQKP